MMLNQLKEAINGFVSIFGGLPFGKKVALASVGVFMLVGILVTAYLSSGDDYTLLYSNLSSDDMVSITDKLKERNILYKLEQGGKVVSVAYKDIYQLRLEFAGEGIPAGGGIGFELFDKSTFGMTEFIQNLNYRRALQGELQRTINSIGVVKTSRVHIVIPKSSYFKEDEKKASASVVVDLKRSRSRLKQEQIDSILNLVASSVEGLAPNNITIVDSKGNLLSFPEEDNDMHRLTVKQMDYRNAIESKFESRIRSMIERVVGKGRVVVRVSADVDFKQVQQTEEIYDPNSQVARSEQRVEENSTGASMPSGIAGVQSNVPGILQEQGAMSKPASASKINETINYEINKTVKSIIQPTSKVEKLSVAVLVDGKYKEVEGADGKIERTFEPLSDVDTSQIDKLVRTAIGFDPVREDTVTIESMRFDDSVISREIDQLGAITEGELISKVIGYSGLGILGLIIFLFVIRPLMGWVTSSTAEVEELRTFPKTLTDMEKELESLVHKEESDVAFKDRVSELIAENPEQASSLVRAWLKTRS